MSFNIHSALNDLGVWYTTEGKNISENWTGISCPFCGDNSQHCGISPQGYSFSCWVCGESGSIKKLLKQLHGGSWQDIRKLFDAYNSALFVNEDIQNSLVTKVEWPEGCTTKLPKIHKEYLKSRGFNPNYLQSIFDIRAVHRTGDWKYRIIIPMYLNGVLVSYIGRDVTGESGLRYMNLKRKFSIIPVKKCLYNVDSIDNFAIVCEGVTDSWRFGFHSVATLGLQFTSMQVKQLAKLEHVFILYDTGRKETNRAEQLGESLAMAGGTVDIVSIEAADPGSLTQKEADEIKRELITLL